MDSRVKHKLKDINIKIKELQTMYQELENMIESNDENEEKRNDQYTMNHNESKVDVENDGYFSNEDSENSEDSEDSELYDDDDDDEKYFDKMNIQNMSLSENLLKSLNMTKNDKISQDSSYRVAWTPPSHPGLNNSSKLI